MKKRKKNQYTSVPYPAIVLIAAIMFIVATVCGVICGIEFYSWYTGSFNAGETVDGDVIEGDAVIGDRINILLMGVDKSEMLSDTIMLVSVNTKDKQVATMSVLRDTHVKMGGYSYKINSLIGTKNKEQATMEAVKKLVGDDVPINYYVTVKTKAFRDVIDLLGGVEYYVPHVTSRDSNGRRGMYYEDPYQDLHIAIPEGKQILDGEAAEGLVRFRYGYDQGYERADEKRVEVQQDFLKEVVKQKLNLKYVNKVPEMYDVAKANIRTNMSPKTAFGIAMSMVDMEKSNINTFSMPGAAEDVNGASYFVANTAETRKIIEQYFMDSAEDEQAE